jgi:putative phage-type endonuclease
MSFRIIDHDQGSIPWLRWRHDGIGGSDTPALMGENPWRTARALFAEKVAPSRYGPPVEPHPDAQLFAPAPRPAAPPPDRRYRSAASRGTALEPYARDLFNRHAGVETVPNCLESRDRPWQRVSLDGLCLRSNRVIEIKCGDKVYGHSEATGKVPGYYIGQLQHILAVTGFGAVDFWVWLPGKTPIHIIVPRDDAYIARMTALQAEFWERVLAARALTSPAR